MSKIDKAPNDSNLAFKKKKKKEVKEDLNLVAMEGFNAWWPLEGSNA
jgi:hypothetical protein